MSNLFHLRFAKSIQGFAPLGFALLCLAAGPHHAQASTIYGGFEDTIGGDYDYNDLVFSLSSPSLILNSSGSYFNKPVLKAGGAGSQSGTPFWNNGSFDGTAYNVGYCVYGGGSCNGGTGISPSAKYLAASNTTTGSANDVTFSVRGPVAANITLTITAAKDSLGWYSVATPQTINYLNTTGTTGTFTFNPGGDFGLVGNNNLTSGQKFYSDVMAAGNTADNVSHFAFFSNDAVAAPEPGTIALLGSALAGLAVFGRRKAAVRN